MQWPCHHAILMSFASSPLLLISINIIYLMVSALDFDTSRAKELRDTFPPCVGGCYKDVPGNGGYIITVLATWLPCCRPQILITRLTLCTCPDHRCGDTVAGIMGTSTSRTISIGSKEEDVLKHHCSGVLAPMLCKCIHELPPPQCPGGSPQSSSAMGKRS